MGTGELLGKPDEMLVGGGTLQWTSILFRGELLLSLVKIFQGSLRILQDLHEDL